MTREHPAGATPDSPRSEPTEPTEPVAVESASVESPDSATTAAMAGKAETRDTDPAADSTQEETVPLPPAVAVAAATSAAAEGPASRAGGDREPRGAGLDTEPSTGPDRPEWRGALDPTRLRPRGGALAIAVLLALLGFSIVVQVKSISTDSSLATTRQEDLVRILSDLEAQEERLRQEIAELEESQRQLTSGVEGRQAALEEATRQADVLGILAGRLPASGPGLAVRFAADAEPLRASTILDAVQELRGAGAEAMQISGVSGAPVRIIASTAFLDADGGLSVAGRRLTGPYTITVIGDPTTMRTALNIPGGVVASVRGDGGNVTIEERAVVDVSALAAPVELRHARPVS